MIHLWYDSDEVNDFHPAVATAVNEAIAACGYDALLELVHHPTIPNSTIIPDFAIQLKASKQYIFVIEVKKTVRDVNSQRYQNQTRSYVSDFSPYWASGYPKYFCLTNIEELILFADRTGPVSTCILKNNPTSHTRFNPQTKDATQTLMEFQASLETILPLIFNRTAPQWDNNWEHIITHFYSNYTALTNGLPYAEATSKELTLFELFRLLAYSYLKDFYTQTGSPNASHFRNFPTQNSDLQRFKTNLSNNFDRILLLDFKQIFSNHPNQSQRIFPEKFDALIHDAYKDLIQCFNDFSHDAVADNHSPSYIFDLLTSQIYDKNEMHQKGKVMSDTELSLLLATLTIDDPNDKIIDPCCGDGALLDAAYDRLNYLALSSNLNKDHNTLLQQIDGIEIDPFLAQLSSFRLLSKNLSQINTHTQANIEASDTFDLPRNSQYDALLINPPFLRNDNPHAPITASDKTKMKQAIFASGVNYFVGDAKQPNLYFYFVNYTWHYLKTNGKAGIILMSKFLNNKDGEHIKAFIIDKVESIISYPRKYFQDFAVTTVILLLKKGNNSPNVSFVRVSDDNILLNPDAIKSVLNIGQDTVNPSFKIKTVPRTDLNPSENWRKYLFDQNYETFETLPFLVNIEHHFQKVSRGNAETNGASTIIYPELEQQTNTYFGYGKRLSSQQKKAGSIRTKIKIPQSLNGRISYGMKNNFSQRDLILSTDDINDEKAFHFPEKSDKTSIYALSPSLQSDVNLVSFYQSGISEFGFEKWCKIVNSAYNNTINPKIIIPRADRTKHSVYYNPHNENLTLSTNFFFCNDIKNEHPSIPNEEQYQFIAAFLMSSFGQIQFELNANNQEGLRKLEGFQIKKFLIPDLQQLTAIEVSNVVTEYRNLSDLKVSVSGDEGLQNNPRRALDIAVAEIVFSKDALGFASVNDMTNYFELFLTDLVEDRKI